jgi:starvation-inducible DNA-binding protein
MGKNDVRDGLSRLLADTYVLQLKTQNFHWNVTGSNFYGLHKLFEDQYGELAVAVDELAEHLRATGSPAPGTMREFLQLTRLKETNPGSAEAMVADLAAANEAVAATCHELHETADDANDEATEDLATQRLRVHQKAAWMLRSVAGSPASRKEESNGKADVKPTPEAVAKAAHAKATPAKPVEKAKPVEVVKAEPKVAASKTKRRATG